MKAIEYLKSLPRNWMPKSSRDYKSPSNSELVRWLNEGAVVINGSSPKATEAIQFPITELVFFPKGKRKTTMVKECCE